MDERPQNELVTVGQHIQEAQKAHPGASGEFSWLLSGITLATKIIQSHVNKAGIANVLGSAQRTNVQGEDVQKLDELANQVICRCLGYRETVGILVSEEDDEPRVVREPGAKAKYVVLFDPLDGSSNIDVNVSIGTIFSILRCLPDVKACDGPLPHILQKGVKQLAAGYVVYGSSTVMAYTTGDGVHMFTLDPSIGAFVLFRENVRMPAAGKMYSVNEAYSLSFPQGVQDYLAWAKGEDRGYSLRYIGSLVADFHRNLLKGGIFLYPADRTRPDGRLRLMYEANPLGFVAEQAGGAASTGSQRIMEIVPERLHQRTPLILGNKDVVEKTVAIIGG